MGHQSKHDQISIQAIQNYNSVLGRREQTKWMDNLFQLLGANFETTHHVSNQVPNELEFRLRRHWYLLFLACSILRDYRG